MSESNVILTGLRLVNFQSWLGESISFSEGLNVVVAENETGKSVIFKALRVTVLPHKCDSEERRDYIRGGALSASIYYMFSDNSAYEVTVNEKFNRYYYFEDLSNPTKVFVGEDLPEDLKDKLSIVFRGETVGNIIDSQKDMFLVNSEDSVNYSVIDMLVINERLTKLIRVIEEERLPLVSSLRQTASIRLEGLEDSIKLFSHRDILNEESIIKFCRRRGPVIDLLQDFTDSLATVRPFNDVDPMAGILLSIAIPLYDYLDSLNRISKVNVKGDGLGDVIELLEESSDLVKTIETLLPSKYSNQVESIESLLSLSRSLENINEMRSLDSEILELKEVINVKGGEQFDTCPIHGSIKLINGECIPNSIRFT